jgi:hypothetical protein
MSINYILIVAVFHKSERLTLELDLPITNTRPNLIFLISATSSGSYVR